MRLKWSRIHQIELHSSHHCGARAPTNPPEGVPFGEGIGSTSATVTLGSKELLRWAESSWVGPWGEVMKLSFFDLAPIVDCTLEWGERVLPCNCPLSPSKFSRKGDWIFGEASHSGAMFGETSHF